MSQSDCFYYQSGGMIGDIGPVYRRAHFIQRGRGLSDSFASLFRFLAPYIKSATKAVGKQALTSGLNIIEGLKDEPLKDLLKKERDRSLQNLASEASDSLRKMSGRGIKRRNAGFDAASIFPLPKRRRRSSSARKRKTTKPRKSPRKKTKTRTRAGGVVKKKRKVKRSRRKTSLKKSAASIKSDILRQFTN